MCVYHPFADETDNEIKDALILFKKQNKIKAVIDVREDIVPTECKTPDAYIVSDFILGEPINITESEYSRIEDFKKDKYRIKPSTVLSNLEEDEKEILNRYI